MVSEPFRHPPRVEALPQFLFTETLHDVTWPGATLSTTGGLPCVQLTMALGVRLGSSRWVYRQGIRNDHSYSRSRSRERLSGDMLPSLSNPQRTSYRAPRSASGACPSRTPRSLRAPALPRRPQLPLQGPPARVCAQPVPSVREALHLSHCHLGKLSSPFRAHFKSLLCDVFPSTHIPGFLPCLQHEPKF